MDIARLTDEAQVPVSPQRSLSRDKSRRYRTYISLAIFGLFTMITSLYAGLNIIATYNKTLKVSQEWTERLGSLAELQALAAPVDAPGNNVFTSNNPEAELQAMFMAYQDFEVKLAIVRQDLQTNVSLQDAPALLPTLDGIEAEMAAVMEDGKPIFEYFLKGDLAKASEQMADMDRTYAAALGTFGHMEDVIRGIQRLHFNKEMEAADTLEKYQYAIAVFIFMMIVSTTYYGFRFAQQAEVSARLIEQEQGLKLKLKAEQRLHTLMENISDLITLVDKEGIIRYLSPSAKSVLGYEPEELLGAPFQNYVRAEDVPGVIEALSQGVQHPRHYVSSLELHLRHKGGSWGIFEAIVSNQNGGFEEETAGVIFNCREISERKYAEDTIKHLAYYDSLTHLPNRILLRDRLQQAVSAAKSEQRSLAVLIMGLDRFREVNDTLGHQNGDLLLEQVGQRLTTALREDDLVARLVGDEFAVLLPRLVDVEDITLVVQRLEAVFEAPFMVESFPLDVHASIGVALFPEHGTDADNLLRHADVAMHLAKQTGSLAYYAPEFDPYNPRRLTLLSELRHAIEADQLVLHYQPKLCLKTGLMYGVEALVRWPHAEHGLIPPDQFIPLAEKTNLIQSLTWWVLRTALYQCRAWQEAGLELNMAVNLSAALVHDGTLAARVAELLETSGVNPAQLTLEITESALMADIKQATNNLERVHQLGVNFSIDDYGTGYSSLAYLWQLPVSEIKIDKSFILGFMTQLNNKAIVHSTIELGHSLALKVVAEGVEDQQTWLGLAELGCDMAQGFHMSRPMPAEKLMAWVMDSPWGAATLRNSSLISEDLRLSHYS
ncbi:MAG: EAL domain-containing protein [Gammaproteobacteria bacterium]